MPSLSRIAVSAAIALTVGLTLSACGSSGSVSTASGPSATAHATSTNPADMLVALAVCLRGQGLDVADPASNATELTMPKSASKADALKATQACAQYEPRARAVVNDPAHHDYDIKMAACLRKVGIDAPDPAPNQPLVIRPHGHVDQVQAAHEKCESQIQPAGAPAN